jgi:hypothetical protein
MVRVAPPDVAPPAGETPVIVGAEYDTVIEFEDCAAQRTITA